MQKNEQKHETIIHGQTDDPVLCPVKQWALLVNRTWSYQGTMENTSVCMVWRNDRREQITSHQVIMSLRAACATIGSTRLGFEPDEIGTHSLRSGAAMEMYLAGVPVCTIMLIGRWSSNAFSQYIRRQVVQLSKDVAQKMLTHRSFRTIPDITPQVVSNEDPRQCNHRDNAQMRRNIGSDASRWVQLPAFSLFNLPIDNAEAINGSGIIFPIAGRSRARGELNKQFIPTPTPLCISYAHTSLIHESWRRLASKLLRCLDADRGEKESGTGRPKNI